MVRVERYQSLLKISSPSVKKKNNNYSLGDVDKAITNIETGEILQAKYVHGEKLWQGDLIIKYRTWQRRGQALLLCC